MDDATYMGEFTKNDAVPQADEGQTNIYLAEDFEYYYFGIKATTANIEPSPLSKVNFPNTIKHYAVPFTLDNPPYPLGMFSNFQVDLKTNDGHVLASLCDNIGDDHSINFTLLSKKTMKLQLQ